MKAAITGGHGFLGWHLACRLRARHGIEPIRIGRSDFANQEALSKVLADVDVVFHIAGVNRADTDEEVEVGNIRLADQLVAALDARPVHVVYSNSVQSSRDSPYGRGKRRAADVLGRMPGTLADVHLPNLFGEHGRPAYNSFVATFCHDVANGRTPTVTGNRRIPLLHVQDAAEALIVASQKRESFVENPKGEAHGIAEVLGLLEGFHEIYGVRGEIPDLSTKFATDLFNTYRSFTFPGQFPIFPTLHADDRGGLAEAVRAHGGTGQAFISTTVPGATRGNHYHLRKVERFFVVRGEAEISLRRLLHDEVVTFRMSGERPGFVDMPTMWVHNIRNVGPDDLVTVFWADQLLDTQEPDQYPELVETEGVR